MRYRIADFFICLGFWIEGKGWDYDEFNAGFKAGCTAMRARVNYEAVMERKSLKEDE